MRPALFPDHPGCSGSAGQCPECGARICPRCSLDVLGCPRCHACLIIEPATLVPWAWVRAGFSLLGRRLALCLAIALVLGVIGGIAEYMVEDQTSTSATLAGIGFGLLLEALASNLLLLALARPGLGVAQVLSEGFAWWPGQLIVVAGKWLCLSFTFALLAPLFLLFWPLWLLAEASYVLGSRAIGKALRQMVELALTFRRVHLGLGLITVWLPLTDVGVPMLLEANGFEPSLPLVLAVRLTLDVLWLPLLATLVVTWSRLSLAHVILKARLDPDDGEDSGEPEDELED